MIKLKEKIGYGFGDMSSSMFWKLFGSYLMIFYTDVFGLPAAVVGTMFLITRLWDSVSDPLMGLIADRTNTRHGKFRPYILWGAIPFGIIGVLTFTTPDLDLRGKIIYAYITYTLMMTAYTVVNVPYASLLGVMSPNSSDRNILSSFRMAFAYIGSFFALLMFMPMVNFFSERITGNKSVEHGWIMAVAVFSVICIILFFLTFGLTRERVKPIRTQSKASEDLKDLMRNKPWWLLLGAGVAALIFNSIRDGATVYYFKYYIQEESISNISLFNFSFVLSGLYLAIGQIANLVGVILSAPLSNKIGKKNTYIGSMAIATILSVIFFWISKENLIWIFIFQVLISICAGSIFPLLWSMYADCADYSEYKTGNRATGLIFSSSSMSQKLGWAIGSALTGWLLSYFGFQANTAQNPETIQGIKMFMSLLPAIGTVLSVILISLYPLSEKKMRKISIALERRRDNDATKL
ncbi:MAG: MFS transporter [Bacteroidales bacterium]|nr:MFS transporter [Bacteroidales bacterium]